MNDLIMNLDKLHTTELGAERIRRNLGVEVVDVAEWCRQRIKGAEQIARRGKNWYIQNENAIITINAHSYTVITAHRDKEPEI